MPAQTLDMFASSTTPMIGAAIEASTDLTHAPVANTAAIVTLTADTTRGYILSQVNYSYSGAPTGGNLKIESPASTIFVQIDVTAAGPGVLNLVPPQIFPKNTNVVITLAAGGAGVSGKANVSAWKLN